MPGNEGKDHSRDPVFPLAGAAQADVVLQCGSTEGPLQLGYVAARIAQLYLIDVLFSEMCRRDLEHCRQHRELVADALSEKHV